MRSVTVRGRLVLLAGLALLGAGYAWSYPVVGALGAALALLVVVEVVAVAAASVPEVRRTVEPLVVVRQGPCEGHLRVVGRAAGVLVRTDAAELVDGALVPVSLPATRVGEAEVRYPIPTRRRGVLRVGPLRLQRTSLTGMAARSEDAGDTVEVRVLPRRTPLHGMASGRRRSVVGGDDSVEQGGTDLVGLHEYTMGDDLRRLHWATSARTGTLMVRDDADPAEPHVAVVLDDRAASYPDPEQFEEAVELAAALCREAVDRGHPLRFRDASGRDEVVVAGSSTRTPGREARDVEWLLAEIDTVEAPLDLAGHRDLDVVVAATGPAADLGELALVLGGAGETTLCVVDPRPAVGAGREGGVLVLRGTGSDALARLWDQAVQR